MKLSLATFTLLTLIIPHSALALVGVAATASKTSPTNTTTYTKVGPITAVNGASSSSAPAPNPSGAPSQAPCDPSRVRQDLRGAKGVFDYFTGQIKITYNVDGLDFDADEVDEVEEILNSDHPYSSSCEKTLTLTAEQVLGDRALQRCKEACEKFQINYNGGQEGDQLDFDDLLKEVDLNTPAGCSKGSALAQAVISSIASAIEACENISK